MIRPLGLLAFVLGIGAAAKCGELTSPEIKFSANCEEAEKKTVLSFTGDILVHHELYKKAMQAPQSFTKIWASTNPLIQKADFSVANLEGPAALGLNAAGEDQGDVGFIYDTVRRQDMEKDFLSQNQIQAQLNSHIYSGTNMVFNFHPSILLELKRSGYDLLTTGNNHALDRGSKGIDKTIAAAKGYGIPTVGTKPSDDSAFQFYYHTDINGIRVAFISCTEETNGRTDRKNQVLLCYKQSDKILKMITTLKNHPSVDAVIVLPHWGVEYKALPNEGQKSYARRFLEAGASAIIGSHPHVLQPWEKYVTSDGRETLIIYSLGNFVAFQAELERKMGAVAYLGLAKINGVTKVSAAGYTATYREGFTSDPVQKLNSAQANLMNQNFGSINRIMPKDKLPARFCR